MNPLVPGIDQHAPHKDAMFFSGHKFVGGVQTTDQYATFDKDLNALRWFMLPSEAQDLLLGHSRNVKQDVPFCPSTYRGSKPHTNYLMYMKRHHSLIAESEYNSYARDIKMMTQRSESNSPARNDSVSKLLPHSSIRERCYSLGSSLFPEMPNKRPSARRRLLSSGSQVDYTDSEASSPSTF
ncbi:unnamed protein product [Nesidiocoris tenuis]|uniref:Uncharacterized protein n=1 Tax=Nesidiocoris tenuis TaxID=355587 RepID=A0A6H5GA67_9HEMI|nr:unnamed protein product [Nesidiocoris tenuis]